MKVRQILPVIALVAASFTTTRGARASCATRSSLRDEIEKSTAVFVGTVVEIKPLGHPGRNPVEAVRFALRRVWKGREKGTTVDLAVFRGDYGFRFDQGKMYLVYARDAEDPYLGYFTTSECSRTTSIAEAAADLRELGDPPRELPPPLEPPRGRAGCTIGAAPYPPDFLWVSLAAGLGWIRRRWQRSRNARLPRFGAPAVSQRSVQRLPTRGRSATSSLVKRLGAGVAAC